MKAIVSVPLKTDLESIFECNSIEGAVLTTEHAASSYGMPVLVLPTGEVIGAGDYESRFNGAILPSDPSCFSDDFRAAGYPCGFEGERYAEETLAVFAAAEVAGYPVYSSLSPAYRAWQASHRAECDFINTDIQSGGYIKHPPRTVVAKTVGNQHSASCQ